MDAATAEFLGELGGGGSFVEWDLQLCSNVLYHSWDLRAA